MTYDVQVLTLTPVSSCLPLPLDTARLLDSYGPLLTSRQREACHLHFDEDWSFAEIATYLGITRSGAHDLVRRALSQVHEYEERLGLVSTVQRLEGQLSAYLGKESEGGAFFGAGSVNDSAGGI